jgi:hypothetical protein
VGKNLASGLVRNAGYAPDTSAPRPRTHLPVGGLIHEPAGETAAGKPSASLNTSERMKLAKEGKALPDGSFPIRNKEDLEKARIRAHQGMNEGAAKAHVRKRAKELGVKLPTGY